MFCNHVTVFSSLCNLLYTVTPSCSKRIIGYKIPKWVATRGPTPIQLFLTYVSKICSIFIKIDEDQLSNRLSTEICFGSLRDSGKVSKANLSIFYTVTTKKALIRSKFKNNNLSNLYFNTEDGLIHIWVKSFSHNFKTS